MGRNPSSSPVIPVNSIPVAFSITKATTIMMMLTLSLRIDKLPVAVEAAESCITLRGYSGALLATSPLSPSKLLRSADFADIRYA